LRKGVAKAAASISSDNIRLAEAPAVTLVLP
jgi:hypothetical protein